MRFKHRLKSHVDVNNVALTDIVMNLFLFFFVTFSLYSTFQAKRETPLRVSLPTLHAGPAAERNPAREIFLTKSGEIFWNEEKLTLAALKEKLLQEKKSELPIALRADRNASVQALTSILEVVRDTGAQNVSLQTELKQ